MMTNRSDRGSAKPRGSQRFERDDVIREPACGLHQGQQPYGAARTGQTHGCTRPVLIAEQKLLRRRGRPHMDLQQPHHATATLVQGPSTPSRQSDERASALVAWLRSQNSFCPAKATLNQAILRFRFHHSGAGLRLCSGQIVPTVAKLSNAFNPATLSTFAAACD